MMRIQPIRYGVKFEDDPFAASVISLLHLNGDLTDQTGKVWEKNALAVTSFTLDGKFGGAVDAGVRHADTYTFRTTSSVSTPIGTGDFTMEIWFKTPAVWPSDGGQIWNRMICGVGNQEIIIWLQARSVPAPRFVMTIGTTGIAASGITLTNSTWYHLAAVREAGVITIYVDGNPLGTTTSTRNIPSTNTIYIGANGNANFFQPNGILDEFRLTSVARYDGAFTPPTAEFPNP